MEVVVVVISMGRGGGGGRRGAGSRNATFSGGTVEDGPFVLGSLRYSIIIIRLQMHLRTQARGTLFPSALSTRRHPGALPEACMLCFRGRSWEFAIAGFVVYGLGLALKLRAIGTAMAMHRISPNQTNASTMTRVSNPGLADAEVPSFPPLAPEKLQTRL